MPARYFGAHLILFPLTIKIFATVAGYTMGTVLAVYSATVLFGFVFYLYCRELGFVSRPLALSVVLLVLHPRWLLYHAVGASEPLFLLLVFWSLLLYRRGSHKTAFVAAGLAAITRIFGILLLPYYVILLVWNKQYRSLAWTLAIPIPLLMLFGYYHLQFGDFLAYFKTNSKLITPPLEMLTQKSSAEHPHFAEYFILMSGLVALAVTAVYRQARELWLYAVIFAAPLLFISHPDISRYSLPLLPVAAIAWHAPLTERKYWIALGLAVCLEYLYVWRAIPMNIAPEIIYLEVAR